MTTRATTLTAQARSPNYHRRKAARSMYIGSTSAIDDAYRPPLPMSALPSNSSAFGLDAQCLDKPGSLFARWRLPTNKMLRGRAKRDRPGIEHGECSYFLFSSTNHSASKRSDQRAPCRIKLRVTDQRNTMGRTQMRVLAVRASDLNRRWQL